MLWFDVGLFYFIEAFLIPRRKQRITIANQMSQFMSGSHMANLRKHARDFVWGARDPCCDTSRGSAFHQDGSVLDKHVLTAVNCQTWSTVKFHTQNGADKRGLWTRNMERREFTASLVVMVYFPNALMMLFSLTTMGNHASNLVLCTSPQCRLGRDCMCISDTLQIVYTTMA